MELSSINIQFMFEKQKSTQEVCLNEVTAYLACIHREIQFNVDCKIVTKCKLSYYFTATVFKTFQSKMGTFRLRNENEID